MEAPIKRTKFPAYFISDLSHAVSFADERLPFALLTSELNKAGVANTGVQVEAAGMARTGLVVRVVRFPKVPERPPTPAGKVQIQEAAASNLDLGRRLQVRAHMYLWSICTSQPFILHVHSNVISSFDRKKKYIFGVEAGPLVGIDNVKRFFFFSATSTPCPSVW